MGNFTLVNEFVNCAAGVLNKRSQTQRQDYANWVTQSIVFTREVGQDVDSIWFLPKRR